MIKDDKAYDNCLVLQMSMLQKPGQLNIICAPDQMSTFGLKHQLSVFIGTHSMYRNYKVHIMTEGRDILLEGYVHINGQTLLADNKEKLAKLGET